MATRIMPIAYGRVFVDLCEDNMALLKRLSSCVTLAVAICLPASAVIADDLRERLLNEGPRGWDEIERLQEDVEVKVTDTRYSNSGELINRYEWEFKCSGRCASLVCESFLREVLQGYWAEGCNTENAFYLTRKTADKPWVIRDLRKATADTHAKFLASHELFRAAAYTVGPHHLGKLIAAPTFKFGRVEQVARDNQPLIEVEFEYELPADTLEPFAKSGTFVVNPARKWALVSFDLVVQYKPDQVQRWVNTLEYYEPHDFPMVRRWEHSRTGEKFGTERGLCEFTLNRVRKIPESEFKLSVYGLPDPR